MTNWIALEGARRAPKEVADQVVSGLYWDIPSAIATLIVGFFVEGVRQSRATPQINVKTGFIRSGSKTLAITDITSARILVHSQQLQNGELDLCFGSSGALELAILLRAGDRIVAPIATRQLLAHLFASTSIDIPRDRYDPSGKFARSGSPYNLTRDEAIALVLDPPPTSGPLPIIV